MPLSESLKILIADDEPIVLETLGAYLKDLGHQVDTTGDGKTAMRKVETGSYDLVFSDIRMPELDGMEFLERVRIVAPDLTVVIITGHGNMELAVKALRLGAADFLSKPIKLIEIDAILGRVSRLRGMAKEQGRLKGVIRAIQAQEDLRHRGDRMVAESQAMQGVLDKVQRAVEANCDAILITGETGTGKEVVAREIYSMADPKKEKPFIAISCPALPETLIESELFGHVKGSFTGANADKAGCFELADGGILFLDEVGDLSAGAQAKLLRVLETRKVRRIGGGAEIEVNVQVVAATNKHLAELAREGKFRQDLYYRLNVYKIHLAPLSEHKEDIVPLAERFLQTFKSRSGLQTLGFSEEVKQLLQQYDYPGNVRELRNIVEGAAIRCRVGLILPEHLNLPELQVAQAAGVFDLPDNEEKKTILDALEKAKWNRRQAAQILGMPYSTLRYKLKKYSLD